MKRQFTLAADFYDQAAFHAAAAEDGEVSEVELRSAGAGALGVSLAARGGDERQLWAYLNAVLRRSLDRQLHPSALQ